MTKREMELTLKKNDSRENGALVSLALKTLECEQKKLAKTPWRFRDANHEVEARREYVSRETNQASQAHRDRLCTQTSLLYLRQARSKRPTNGMTKDDFHCDSSELSLPVNAQGFIDHPKQEPEDDEDGDEPQVLPEPRKPF